MKIYAMSDIHGCYEEYLKALELINFSDDDLLYVVGDIVDRGKEPIKLLQDMMLRSNVIPLIGNHEYAALRVLNTLGQEITEESINNLKNEDLISYYHWISDGGLITSQQFCKLSKSEREDILEYLGDFILYAKTEVNGKKYILVHAGLEPFDINKSLDDYSLDEIIFKKVDYNKVYYPDVYLITGHTPTLSLPKPYKGKIYVHNNHISIDCGCVFGGNLGVFCLNTHETFYVKHKAK